MKIIEIKTEDALNFIIDDFERNKKSGEDISLMDFYLENYEGALLELLVSLHESNKVAFDEFETDRKLEEIINGGVVAVENYGGYLSYVSGFDKNEFIKLLNEKKEI